MFDHRELGDIDIVYEAPACEELQRELVVSIEDVHVELVSRIDYDAAQVKLAALREELDTMTSAAKAVRDEWRVDQQLLEAAERRNAACNAEIVAMVESALRRSFTLGQVYWQQADSDSTRQQNKSDETMETQAQHILNVVKSINELTKPTESGASD